jgi:hypothetical protein
MRLRVGPLCTSLSGGTRCTHRENRGFLTRAQIRAPFDGEIISHETRFSDTIDNVKAKIDNVKAKTQDEED